MYVKKTYTRVTTEQIEERLATDDLYLERCILALYKRQTELERQTSLTYEKNERGFQVADAREFTAYAHKIELGQHLSAAELRSARRPWHRGSRTVMTVAKYRKQLWRIIEANAKRKYEETH